MTATFASLLELDRDLARARHLPLTPWWREQLSRWYEHHTAKTLVARVGRGGTKSTTATKVALNETLFGDWLVPPGETHWFVLVSVSKDEAAARLLLLESYLRALGEKFERVGDSIVLESQARGFRVLACQVASVSGPRAYGFACDELAKWRSSDRLSNPASEVVASANAMCVTHPRARRLLISSPVGLTDFHHKRFELGDTAEQLVAQAPTWVANPSITEAQTHELEPDPRIWAREYQAIPQAGALSVFEPQAVANAFVWPTTMCEPRGRIGVIDASSGRKDTWSFGVAAWRHVDGARRLVFDKIGGFEGAFWKQRTGEQIVADVAETFKRWNVRSVHADQREALMLNAAFARHGLRFHEHTWTAPAKERAVSAVRGWLRDRVLLLPEHERLRDELLDFEERVTTSGAFSFGARGTGYDDFVSLLLTAAMADADRHLPDSPTRKGTRMFAALSAPRTARSVLAEEAADFRRRAGYGGRL
jgi:hypothetical protein